MHNQTKILQEVMSKLSCVIDPEMGADVVRMNLIQKIKLGRNGTISYVFRPSSPFCPLAVPLAMDIMQAIAEVKGITDQAITVEGYIESEKLNKILNSASKNKKVT